MIAVGLDAAAALANDYGAKYLCLLLVAEPRAVVGGICSAEAS